MAMLMLPWAIEGIAAAVVGLTAASAAALALQQSSTLNFPRLDPPVLLEPRFRGPVLICPPRAPPPPPPRSPPPPPPRPPNSKETLKKLAKAAAKKLIMEVLKVAGKMIKEAVKEKLEKENTNRVVNTWGPLGNQTQMDMKLKDQHQWCGQFQSGPPLTNSKNETPIQKMNKSPPEVIWHKGVPPSGSKAAVAYTAHSRQWILAWHVPLRSSSSSSPPNKVYVECGPERNIDWNVIEKKLDASTNISECDDAVAEITNEPNAALAAIFIDYTN